jgi:hypothetical protein
MGLSTYASELHTTGRARYFAIERFERFGRFGRFDQEVAGDTVHLRHQENLVQALDLDWRNTDTHAKNVALLCLSTGTEATEIYDSVPNLLQDGLFF